MLRKTRVMRATCDPGWAAGALVEWTGGCPGSGIEGGVGGAAGPTPRCADRGEADRGFLSMWR